MTSKFEIVVPGLFDLPRMELDAGILKSEMYALNRLLRQGSVCRNRAFSVDDILQQVIFGQSSEAAMLPLAQAFLAAEDEAADRCLLVEAVNLRPDLQSAILMPIAKSAENLQDITIIINDLSKLFKVDCDITAVSEGLYLMRLGQVQAPVHYPSPLSVLGKPANPYIEQSREHLPWYRLLNEMQMFMFQHPVNAERSARGRLPINSLWCWGGGRRPSDSGQFHWFCDDPILTRFARGLGHRVDAVESLPDCDHGEDIVAIDLRLLEALKSESRVRLEELLLDLERRLLRPALEHCRRHASSLTLRAGAERDIGYRSAARLRFWRRPSTLADWLPD